MDTSTAPPAVRRSRLGRRVVIALVALAVLVALSPLYLGPVLRPLVVDALEDELDARARVQAVSFAWPARLEVRGLELADPDGAPLASLDALRLSFELGPLLSGKFHGEIELDYPELHVSRAADGVWNWERALSKPKEPLREEAPAGEGDEDVPEVRARVRLSDGHVLVHGPTGDTTLNEITLALDVDGLERPAPFRLSLGVRGPLAPAGKLALEGSFTAASGGHIDLPGLAAEGRLALEELDLAGLAPALALLGPVTGLGGTASGKVELALAPGLALTGQSDVEVRDLALRGPLSGDDVTRIARVELHGRAAQQGDGGGTQYLELSADSFLTLAYEGRSSLPASGAGAVSGALTLAADLAQLSEIARGWVPLQAGVALAGLLEAGLELESVLADRRPASGSVRARGSIANLAARDAAGRALDLAELADIGLELDASADLHASTLAVPSFSVRAGTVRCEGRLEAAGFALGGPGRDLELRSGAFRLEADLEKLRGTLAQVVDLGDEPGFGGRLRVDATLAERGEALELEATVEGRALSLGGTTLADLGGQLRARRAEDGVLAGTAEARLGALGVRLGDREPLALPGAALELDVREDAAGHGEHRLGFTTDGDLALAVAARSERADGALALRADVALDGSIARLAELVAPLTPVQPGLSGALRARGEVTADLLDGALARAGGRLELVLSGLQARDAAGEPLRLEALAETTLTIEGELDAAADRAELRAFTLTAGGLELSGSGRALALGSAPVLEEGKVRLSADLARLGPELAHVLDLSGWSVSGSPLVADVELTAREQRIEADGRLAAATVRLARPDEAPIVLADVGLDFDLGYDSALGSLHVRNASFRSATAQAELAGTLNELLSAERARGAMQLEVTGELARILGDVGLETPACGRKTSGLLSAEVALEGDGGAFKVTGKTRVETFRLELAADPEGAAPLVLAEPVIALDCAARVTLAELDLEIAKLTLESGLARGAAQGRIENLRALGAPEGGAGEVRFVGLNGQLAYVPDRLGAVLAPFLPGKLSGSEEQRVSFTLDGRARDLELASLLAGSEARVDLGIGRFERPEIELDGALVVEAKDRKLRLRGDLGANGGTLQLDGELDLARGDAPPRSKLALTARGVRANAGLAPLLARLHPAFATAELAQGSLDGLIGLSLDVSYDAPLALEALEAGWEALPKEPINGAGRLELTSAALRGSPFLALLSSFGVDATKALDVRPIEFTIQHGRVTYAKPWTWTFAGTETTFTGSLGLDESLDLAWNVAVTAELVERWGFLESLLGERLSIPLRGSVRAPRLEADELLADLAARAAKRELESRLGLGGKASGDDPAALLERADTLWSKGQKAEAAAVYTRLREEFKLSLTYALNKDRIKDRSKYK